MIRRPRGHFSTSSFILDKEQVLMPEPILEIVAHPQNNTGLEKPKPINPYEERKKKPSKYQRG
jgi:hypothetical protein